LNSSVGEESHSPAPFPRDPTFIPSRAIDFL
jgi:hypothetical protein